MGQRNCDVCNTAYQAKRPSSRYCSERCRKRAQRGGVNVVQLPDRAPDPEAEPSGDPSGALALATRRQLTEADRLDTVIGQQALAIAARLDASGSETGAGVASLSKEFRAVMEQAMDGVGAAADPLDELRARRDAKRNAG